MAESFADLLKRHRVAAGFSQETLAERSGVSVDAISYLERGVRHAPHKATLDLLFEALTLDDRSRRQLEEAARLARARGPQAQQVLNNLPAELTSFVDREKEVAEINGLLQSYRLVTLVGTGGAGKTRCAIRVARGLLDASGDGIWLADLAPTSDPALVSTVIGLALRVQETPNRPMLETLLAHLKRKRIFLILDNCEHVIEEARRVVAAILRDCPDVRILATSRETLGIVGEHAYRMPPLPVPSTSGSLSADEMLQFGAVQLFSDRAVSALNDFTLSVENAPHVADLCRRLDGIPLAIELAAARVNALAPRELVQRLDERFRLLIARDRSALPRHRTIYALIDWSYGLLTVDERWLFRKLSVFAGGFTLETATAVCSDCALDEIAVLDLLSSLVNKSLVQAVVAGDDTRYRLLESTRQYAREKLSSAGEEETTARAHARACLELAEQLSDAWETTPDRAWFARAGLELENFRTALSWSFGARGDILLGQCLTGALRRVWSYLFAAEGQRWVQTAQQSVSEDTPNAVQAALDLAESGVASTLKQYKKCLVVAERSLTRYRELADERGIALAEGLVGAMRFVFGDIVEGEALAQRFLEATRAREARKSAILALEYLASARYLAGDLCGARERFGEALTAARTLGAEMHTARIALGLAEVEFRGGDGLVAVRLVDEALPILRSFDDTRNVALAWYNMAAYLVALRRFDEARVAAREAVNAANDAEFSVGVVWSLQHLAAIAALRPSARTQVVEDRRRAGHILGYVDSRLATLEALRECTEQQEYDAIIPALCDELGGNELSMCMTEGASWSEDRAVAEAMLI